MDNSTNQPPIDSPVAAEVLPGRAVTGGDSSPGPRNSRLPVWIVLGAAAAMAVLVGVVDGPKEVARWYLAAAIERYQQGNLPVAIDNVSRAIRWDANNAELIQYRAVFRFQAEDYEGTLQDCNRVIELAPYWRTGYQLRSNVYRRLQRDQDVVRDWDEIVRLSKAIGGGAYCHALNNRAYMRALAGIELKEGLKDAEQAIAILRDLRGKTHEGSEAGSELNFSLAITLDTRGYLYYLNGLPKKALPDLNAAIDLLDDQQTQALIRFKEFGRSRQEVEQHQRELNHGLSAVYHHRGLVYRKLGQFQNARSDLARAKDMGFDPEKE